VTGTRHPAAAAVRSPRSPLPARHLYPAWLVLAAATVLGACAAPQTVAPEPGGGFTPRATVVGPPPSLPSGGPVAEPAPAEPPPRRASPPTRRPTRPRAGSLRSLVEERVGDFRLVAADDFPDAINQGASDAVQLAYRSAGGVELFHVLAAYPSPDLANQAAAEFYGGLVGDGYEPVDQSPIVDDRTSPIGLATVLTGPDDEAVLWTNRGLVGLSLSDRGFAVEFFELLPY